MLLYDSKCGICRTSANIMLKLTKNKIDIQGYDHIDKVLYLSEKLYTGDQAVIKMLEDNFNNRFFRLLLLGCYTIIDRLLKTQCKNCKLSTSKKTEK